MKYYVLVLCCCVYSISQSQNCASTFFGEVYDFHDGTPIIDAAIYIENLEKYTTTDANGKFSIENLCDGLITVVVSHLACDTKRFEIEIKGNTFREINLEHHIEDLDEVSVKSLGLKQTKTGQETILKTDVINKYSALSLGDALNEVPGVSSIKVGNAIVKPIINGLHSSRVLILNNGVRQQDQEWGVEHAPNIDINTAGQISVIKGSGALAYGGDAIGGVIVIKPSRIISKDTLYGRTIIGGQSNGRGYNMTSTLNKNYSSGWFGQIQGSYKVNGDFKAPDYYLTNTGLKSKGISARLGKKKFESGFELYYSFIDSEIAILRSAHIGNIKNLATAINNPIPIFTDDLGYDITQPKQEVTHHLFKGLYYKRFENFGKVDIQYDYQNNQRFEFDIRRGGRSEKPAVDLKLQTHTITANAKIDNKLERKYNFGLLGRYQDNFASPDTGVRRLIPDYEKYDFGVYGNTELSINDNLIVDAGLRYDFSRIDALKFYKTSDWESQGYDQDFNDIIIGSVVGGEIIANVIDTNASQYLTNPIFDYHNISAAVGMKYQFNDKNTIALGYNLASRAPNVSELFSDGLHHSAARIETGDIRIDSERSNRIMATYNYNNTRLNFQVESYYNFINDFIYLVPGPEGIIPLIRGPFPVWDYIQTNARIFGMDITANYQLTNRWNLNHKSSFIKGYDDKADLPLIDTPPFTTTNSISYTNSKWYNFNSSLQSEWAFKQNEFPTEYNFTIPIANEDDILVDLSPPPAYHLMHFQSEITLPVFKQSSLTIRLSVDNILDTKYRNYLNRLRFFADEIGRNFRLQLQLNY